MAVWIPSHSEMQWVFGKLAAVARILGMILFSLFPSCSWLSVSSGGVTKWKMPDARLHSLIPLQKQIFFFLSFLSLLRVFIPCTFCLAGFPEGRAPGVFWHHQRRWLQLDDDGAPSHRVWASKPHCLPAWQWHLLHHLPEHPPRNWAASVVCSFLRQKNGKANAEAGH